MARTHPTYQNDFREEAVNLLLSSGRPLKRVAAEPFAEIRRLQRENEYLRRQREILKKP